MSKSQWEMARPNEAKLQEILDNGCDWEQLAQSLLSWLSDDEVGEFARLYGYFDGDNNEEEEEDDEMNPFNESTVRFIGNYPFKY